MLKLVQKPRTVWGGVKMLLYVMQLQWRQKNKVKLTDNNFSVLSKIRKTPTIHKFMILKYKPVDIETYFDILLMWLTHMTEASYFRKTRNRYIDGSRAVIV